jgi:CheY-like chemotaxis protein
VKSLVEMHGGTVEVQSAGENQGSEFRVRLPILVEAREESPKPDPTHDGVPSQFKHRVLVVDDNKAAADLLGMVVRMLGHDVRTACDGQEGVEVAESFLPDVVLMDLGMPRMNGFEAARKIREQPWGQQMLLIALTGWGQAEDKQRTKDAGFDHHLVKPAEPAELQRLLASLPVAGKR